MSRPRGVAPERVRLPLSDGDYVDVKKSLTAGEYRKLLYDQYKDTALGEKMTLDHAKVGVSKLLAYIVGWSFVSVIDQQPIPYDPQDPEELRRSALNDLLDPDTYRELITAINAHEERQAAALEAQKKNPYYRATIVSDLMIASRLHWKYDWVAELPRDVYEILVAELRHEEQQA